MSGPPPTLPPLPPLDREATLADAARFVREVLLRAHSREGRFVVAPLVPVIGLPRSGRTTFLAALGQILAGPRERYPVGYEGRFALEPFSLEAVVTPSGGGLAHAAALEPWIGDLGHESRALADRFLAHARFPPPTSSLTSGARFLVAPLKKDATPFARLVLLESPGDAVRAVFHAGSQPDPIASFRALGDDDSPAAVCAGSLDRATGVVLLLDSTRASDEQDLAHEGFFRLLARGLAARARDALKALAAQLEQEEKSENRATLEAAVARIRRAHQRSGEELCLLLEAPLLRTLADALEPETEAEPRTRGDLRRLLRDLVALPDEKTLIQAIGTRLLARLASSGSAAVIGDDSGREAPALDVWARAAARLRGCSLEVAARLLATEPLASEGPFPRLRGLSLVASKADAGHEGLRMGARSRPWLEQVEGSLRLLGGDVRAYESSSVGYTQWIGARAVPGPRVTQVATQVVEPVFDLLGVPREEF